MRYFHIKIGITHGARTFMSDGAMSFITPVCLSKKDLF